MIHEAKKKMKELIDQASINGLNKQEVDRYNNLIDNIEKTVYPEWKAKEKQHTVPQTLLEGFTEDNEGGLFLYDLSAKNFLSNNKIPLSGMLKEENIYVFKDVEWKDNFFFEKFTFSMYLEWGLKEIIKKIKDHSKLIETDWQILSWFIAFQFTRTKKFMKGLWESTGRMTKIDFQQRYKTYEQFKKLMDRREKETWEKIEWDPKDLYDYMMKWEYDVTMTKESSMVESMKLANDLWPLFLNAHYEVLETKKSNFFICSDNPFFIIPPKDWPRNRWLWLIEPFLAEKIIPINKRQCLRIIIFPESKKHWISISYKTINQKMTNRLNQYICKNAERFIVSKDMSYLKEILADIDHKKLAQDKSRENVIFNEGFWLIMDHSFYPY